MAVASTYSWRLCKSCLLLGTAIFSQYHIEPKTGDNIEIVEDDECETEMIRLGALGFPGIIQPTLRDDRL